MRLQALTVLMSLLAVQAAWSNPPVSIDTAPQPVAEAADRAGDRGLATPQSGRIPFGQALERLRPGRASAAIVQAPRAGDLARLLHKPFKTAVLVLYGEIILLSSGSEEFIHTLPESNVITQDASFALHTHPDPQASGEEPTCYDRFTSTFPEYLLTPSGAYRYYDFDVNDRASLGTALTALKTAQAQDLSHRNTVASYAALNRLIADQARVKHVPPDSQLSIFRS